MPFFNSIMKLKAKLGIYAILGNHDHWENAQLTRKLMERNGIRPCDNQSWWVKTGNDRLKIGGVGDLWEDVQEIDSTRIANGESQGLSPFLLYRQNRRVT